MKQRAKLFNSPGLITGYFGEIYKNNAGTPYPHKGLDVVPSLSDWSILNPMNNDTEVVYIDHSHVNYGKMVLIHSKKHHTTLRFCHLDLICVNVGDKIKKNQKIGIMGSTGNSPNGAHLHLECIPQIVFGEYDFKNNPWGGNCDPLPLLYYLGVDIEEY